MYMISAETGVASHLLGAGIEISATDGVSELGFDLCIGVFVGLTIPAHKRTALNTFEGLDRAFHLHSSSAGLCSNGTDKCIAQGQQIKSK